MGIEERLAELRQKAMTRPRKKWYQKWWGIFLILFLFLIIIIIGGVGIYILKTAQTINQDKYLAALKLSTQNNKILTEGSSQNYYMGTSSPEITIVEFSDFACPYCKESLSIIKEIGIRYQDKVKIIYRDYPGHSNSLDLALAARCAGEQEKFWEMHDELFAEQDTLKLNELSDMAENMGMNKTKFSKCLSEQKYLAHIQADISDGDKLEIKATPTWFINEHKIEGAIPRDNFINIIETLLKK